MVTLLISHDVKNFNEFKKVFDEHEQMRKKAEIKVIGLYSSITDKNHVTAISEAKNVNSANAFISSPDLKAAMKKAGVSSKPDIKILNKVE